MTKLLRAILAGVFTLIMSLPLAAHQIEPPVADLRLENGAFRLDIRLDLEAILSKIGSGFTDAQQTQNAEKYDEYRAMGSGALHAAFDSEAFAANVKVLLDGKAGTAQVSEVSIPQTGDPALVRYSHIVVTGSLGSAKELQLGWDAGYGAIIIRLMDDSNDYNAYLTHGAVTDPISTKGATVISFWTNLVNYIVVGYYHILPLGTDHILFIVGLFLMSVRLKPLLWQVTTFTLAHSITLALGVLGILVVPPWIVEPLIAVSIVYVALENIFLTHMSRWRLVVVFLFGLLHGQGFAGALTEFGLSANNVISGLIGFNLGVELGQLSVILICFALVGYWFAQKHWYRQIVVVPASVVIALVGSYWVVQRVGLI